MLKQPQYQPLSLGQEVIILFAVNAGIIEDMPLDRCADFQEQLLRFMSSTHPQIGQTIAETGDLTSETEEALTQAINDFKATFGA
jgi:F-type H+-transporting ATPase subunit alpha